MLLKNRFKLDTIFLQEISELQIIIGSFYKQGEVMPQVMPMSRNTQFRIHICSTVVPR